MKITEKKPPRLSHHTWYTFEDRHVDNNTIVQVWTGVWVPRACFRNGRWFRVVGTDLEPLEAVPTAWMPLPPPPAAHQESHAI